MSYLIFDLVIAILLVLAVFQGYRRGFVLTLCGFLAVFVAFFGATILSNALAEPVSHAITPVIENQISNSIHETLEEQGYQFEEPQPGHEEETPAPEDQFSLDQILNMMKDSALIQSFSDAIRGAVNEGVVEVTTSAAQTIASYIARELARMVLFLISFVLVLVAWTLLSRALDLAFRLPVLSTLNHWSGAAVGLLKGGVLLFIACWLLRELFPAEVVEQSYLLKFFCTTNPLVLALSVF